MIYISPIFIAIDMVLRPQTSGLLSIDQALALAERQSFAVENSTSQVRANQALVRESNGRMGPQLQTRYQYLRNQRQQSGNIGGNNIIFSPFDTSTVTTAVSWQYDIAGNLKAGVRAAKSSVSASEQLLIATLSDMRLGVRRAYIGVLRAKSLANVSVQGRENIAASVLQAEQRLAQRQIAKIDVDRLRAQLAQADAEVIGLKNSTQIARQLLNLAMSAPIESEFEVKELVQSMDAVFDISDLVARANKERAEVRSIEYQVNALTASRKANRVGMDPSVSVSVQNQTTLDPAGLNPQREVNNAVIGLTIPIYDAGQTRARVKQSDEQIIQAVTNLSSLRLGISQEIRAAVTSMGNAKARHISAKRQWELAQEVVRIARIRRDAGEGTVLEIIDAETQWVQAQNGVILATYDYITAYAELQRAVGVDNLSELSKKKI